MAPKLARMADIADDQACANCSHLASAHQDTADGDNTGSCTMANCDCSAFAPASGAGGKPAAPPAKAAPPSPPASKAGAAARGGRYAAPAPPAPAPGGAGDDAGPADAPDLDTAIKATSDALDQAVAAIANVDLTTLQPQEQTFVALVHAADTAFDLVSGEIKPDDDAGDQTTQAEAADAAIVAARNVGEGLGEPSDELSSALDAIHAADLASGDVLAALKAPDPDEDAGTDTDTGDDGTDDGGDGSGDDGMASEGVRRLSAYAAARRAARYADAGTPAAPAPTDDDSDAQTGKGTGASGDDTIPVTKTSDSQAFRMPIMVIEGVDTGDGRYIEPEVLTWRDLPLPVMAVTSTTEGHDGAELVGRLDSVERIDVSAMENPKTGEPYGEGVTALRSEGVFTTLENAEMVAGLVADEFLRGVSVDIGDVISEIEFLDDDGNPLDDDDEVEGEPFLDLLFGGDHVREKLTQGRVMGVTICPFPAFEGAYIELDDGNTTPTTREAADTSRQVAAIREHGEGVLIASIRNTDVYGSRDLPAGGAMVAAAGPEKPPSGWFTDPNFAGPTPLTIDPDGRIYGHLATWSECHTGVTGRCVTAPRSRTNYGYFRTGAVLCDDESLVATGPITLGGGHAGLPLGPAEAIRHYDETGAAVADVAAGEDRYGVWVAGAMRPDVTASQIRALRASALSGDWRNVGGNLELVAALAVNAPGFPVVRSRVASGAQVALVAAGAREVMVAATERAAEDRELMATMRAQWPLMQALLEKETRRVDQLRTDVHKDKLRRFVRSAR